MGEAGKGGLGHRTYHEVLRQVSQKPGKILFAVMLVILLFVCVLLPVLGAPEVETDLTSHRYMKSDGVISDRNDALRSAIKAEDHRRNTGVRRRLSEEEENFLARKDAEESDSGVNQSSVRKLSKTPERSVPTYRVELYYKAKKGSVFDSKVLDDVRAFEKKLVSLPSYSKLCVAKSRADSACRGLISPTRFFYGTISEKPPDGEEADIMNTESNVKLYVVPDGMNEKRLPTKPILQKMSEDNVWKGITGMQALTWYFDAEFPSSKIMRAYVWFGLPLRGFDNHLVDLDRQKQEYKNFVSAELFPFLEEASTDNVQILYTGPVLTDHEVFLAVRKDTYFSIGSLLFVWLYMSFHLRTPILALLGMGVVGLSFPMGLVWFRIFGYEQMAIINYLALFILTGIGADNIFILTDLWRQAQRKTDDAKEQLHQTMHKAGKAVSVCGVTTACSFLANSASAVRPVREFGIFVGTCILCNLLLCLTLYPLILILFERFKNRNSSSKGKESEDIQGTPSPVLALPAQQAEMRSASKEVSKETGHSRSEQFLYNKFAPAVMRFRYGVIAFGLLFTIISMVLTATSLKTSQESPKFFESGAHNLGDVFDLEKKFTNETLWVSQMEHSPLRICQGCPFSDGDQGVGSLGCLFVGAMCMKTPCNQFLQQPISAQCTGRGECNQKTGSCSCSANWAGADCDAPRYTSRWTDCGDNILECSGHGVCKAAMCWCDLGWFGDQCAEPEGKMGFKAPAPPGPPKDDLAPECVWGEWSAWSVCSATCGLGTQRRSQEANLPGCGRKARERVCQVTACPVDCVWNLWSTWSSCDVECGSGSQQRSRSYKTEPQGSGASCSGAAKEAKACIMPACQEDCGVTEWSSDGPCSNTCGGGIQKQTRAITKPGPGCPDVTQRTVPCEDNPVCPVTCPLTPWKDAGPCSASCGAGVVPQRRQVVAGTICPSADSPERLRTVACQIVVCEPEPTPAAPGPAPRPDPEDRPERAPTPGQAPLGPPPSPASSKPPAKQSKPPVKPLPDSLVATVSVVFGLDPENPIDRSKTIVDGTMGAPKHKDAFDFTDGRVQLALFQLCNVSKVIFKGKKLAIRRSACFMSDFNLWLRGRGFKGIPIEPSSMSGEALSSFLSDQKGKKWKQHAGFDYKDATKVRWVVADFLTNLPKKMPAADAWTQVGAWDDFIKEWNDGMPSVPPGLRHAFHTSQLWVRAETELRLVKSTFVCAGISIVGALLAIVLFTGNIALAVYLVSVVLCIVICLSGLMFGMFGWPFGVVEAIGLIVFVGFSVDYSLHIIEAYNQSAHFDRFARVRQALLQSGSAVFSAGVTSFGAGLFIMLCSIKIFVQFGMVVILNTFLSMLFSLCFLSALLMVIGPTENFGSLLALYAWIRGYKEEDLQSDAVSGQVLGPNNETSGPDGSGAPAEYQWRDYDENPELRKQKEQSAAATDANPAGATVLQTLDDNKRSGSPSGMVGLGGRVMPTTIGSQDPPNSGTQ